MPFQFHPTPDLPEVLVVTARSFADDRGYFKEVFKAADFIEQGIDQPFVQDNFSYSARGVLRGLHYQKAPAAQGKLVMALQGEIFDVAVDIRQQSPTYGRWVGRTLSAHNHEMLWVPPGFAHGFCVLSETAAVLYKVTAPYAPAHDRGIIWNDPVIGIAWPTAAPLLSDKDAQLPPLAHADNEFVYQAA